MLFRAKIHTADQRVSILLVFRNSTLLHFTSFRGLPPLSYCEYRAGRVLPGVLRWAVYRVSPTSASLSQLGDGDCSGALDLWQEDWTHPLKWKLSTDCKLNPASCLTLSLWKLSWGNQKGHLQPLEFQGYFHIWQGLVHGGWNTEHISEFFNRRELLLFV